MDEILERLQETIIAGEPEGARDLAAPALEAGIAPLDAIDAALTPGMQTVGQKYECGDYFIPDLIAAELGIRSDQRNMRADDNGGFFCNGLKVL